MKRRLSTGNTIFMVLFFACVGVTTEVVFTAFMALVNQRTECGKPLIAMQGTSYVWMLFIYGLIPIIGSALIHKIHHWNIIARLLLYVVLIYAIEFTSGYILKVTTGACPWNYVGGHNVMGLIQLDYAPAWAFFGWMIERLYMFVYSKLISW